ncbi:MAG TPA: type II toxin-antitoxin system RelE/ParE family toxin [Candidatus Limnocylindria bacterium]|nr:type II toxin-antitoxin system RelE/ParE family toxin [Candidatus Limnocylindria bacterium]
MSLALHRSDYFNEDFDLQYRWYLREAGEEIAERYLAAVIAMLRELARHPELGRERKFRDEALKGMRSFRVARPFHRHLLFYRATERELFAERVMHGTRDLPRRLRESPGAK